MKGGEGQSDAKTIYVSYINFHHEIPVGNLILIDDGDLSLEVIDKNDDSLICKVGNSGQIKNRKSINTPGIIGVPG